MLLALHSKIPCYFRITASKNKLSNILRYCYFYCGFSWSILSYQASHKKKDMGVVPLLTPKSTGDNQNTSGSEIWSDWCFQRGDETGPSGKDNSGKWRHEVLLWQGRGLTHLLLQLSAGWLASMTFHGLVYILFKKDWVCGYGRVQTWKLSLKNMIYFK